MFTGNGTLESEFCPSGGESDFTFKPGSITEPLAPYRSSLIFPRNLRRLTSGSGAHEKNMGGLWTGMRAGGHQRLSHGARRSTTSSPRA